MHKRLVWVVCLACCLSGCGAEAETRMLQPGQGVSEGASQTEQSMAGTQRRMPQEVPEDVKQEILEYSQRFMTLSEAVEAEEIAEPDIDESKDAGQEGNFTEISTVYCTIDDKNRSVKLQNVYSTKAVFTIWDQANTQISEEAVVPPENEFDWVVPEGIETGVYICKQVSESESRYVIIELKVR